MTTTEKIVANSLLLAWGRISMAAMPFMVAMLGLWLNASFASKAEITSLRESATELATKVEVNALKERTIILETNSARGRADREQFQNATTAALQELLRLSSATNERLARFEEQLKSQQMQIDRKP